MRPSEDIPPPAPPVLPGCLHRRAIHSPRLVPHPRRVLFRRPRSRDRQGTPRPACPTRGRIPRVWETPRRREISERAEAYLSPWQRAVVTRRPLPVFLFDPWPSMPLTPKSPSISGRLQARGHDPCALYRTSSSFAFEGVCSWKVDKAFSNTRLSQPWPSPWPHRTRSSCCEVSSSQPLHRNEGGLALLVLAQPGSAGQPSLEHLLRSPTHQR